MWSATTTRSTTPADRFGSSRDAGRGLGVGCGQEATTMDKYGEAEHAKILERTRPYREAKFEREELWGLISRARLLGDGVPNSE